MNTFILRAACILATCGSTAFAQQTIPVPTAGPGTSPYDTRATIDSNQSSYSVRNVPQVSAPPLVTTLSDTCMGSASVGLSVTGFGATAGTTRVDEACVRRLDAREFRAMGLTEVALSLLCQSESNRRAVEATGHLCPGTTTPLAKVTSTSDTAALTDDEKYRDPIVRARLGLPALNGASASAAPIDGKLKPSQAVNAAEPATPSPAVSPKYQAPQAPDVKPVQPQVADAKLPAAVDADALEQKIRKFGWSPVAAKPDGVVAAAALK
jgi:hypothetical protein